MEKYLLIVSFFLIYNLDAQETVYLSLEEAIQTGLGKSIITAISEKSVQAAEARVKETASAFYPAVVLSGSYFRLSNVPSFELAFPVDIMPHGGIEIFPNIVDHYNARISLQQPIFTGSRLRESRNAAHNNAEAEQYSHKANLNELEFAIIKAYWNVYRTHEAEKVVQASMEQLREHMRNVENLYDHGMITRNEVLKVKVQLSNLRVHLVEVQNNV